MTVQDEEVPELCEHPDDYICSDILDFRSGGPIRFQVRWCADCGAYQLIQETVGMPKHTFPWRTPYNQERASLRGKVVVTVSRLKSLQSRPNYSAYGVYLGEKCAACDRYLPNCQPDCWLAAAIREGDG